MNPAADRRGDRLRPIALIGRVPALLLAVPVWIYRKVISPCKPPTCRFHPTCSAYALESLRVHGALRGSWLTAKRVCRCHPFTEPGFDPVPPRALPGRAVDGDHGVSP